MKAALAVLAFSMVTACCFGQTTNGSKNSAKKADQHHPPFVCPDPEAQKACTSYEELLRANDDGLPEQGYVCFRKSVDDLFIVSFSKPYFQKHWDQQLKKSVTDLEQTVSGWGFAHTYRDGVQDSSVMPAILYGGKWSPNGVDSDSGTFVSDKMNFKTQDEKDTDIGVSIDDSQLAIAYRYQNKYDKGVTYSLTIQRSTGRFAEYFQQEADKIPFDKGTGRCIFRGWSRSH